MCTDPIQTGNRTPPWRALGRTRRASAVVEFAIAGPTMILLAFIVIENGVMFLAQSVLDNATRSAARQVMIGAVTTSTAFRTAVCSNVSTFLDCSALQFYVVSSSSAFPTAAVFPGSTGAFSNSSFSSGSGGDYVLVEVAYNRSYITPWLVNIGGTSWVLLSIQAFQNEPFL